jgi:hypothetical protein
MYNEDVTRIPQSKKEMWVVLREQFEYVQMVLEELPVETEVEALSRKTRPAWLITYRGNCIVALLNWLRGTADFLELPAKNRIGAKS